MEIDNCIAYSQNRRMQSLRLVVFLLLLPPACRGRSWTDIETLHGVEVKDDGGAVYLQQQDALYANTISPTMSPTTAPPTTSPTASQAPSDLPSTMPSSAPSSSPSSAPTAPPDPYPPNPPPYLPDFWYFNYNTSVGAKYGPGYPGLIPGNNGIHIGFKNNQWIKVSQPPYPHNYWQEFTNNGYGPWKGVLENRDVNRNRCDRIGEQSPIDLRPSGAKCEEHHQIRTRPGDFRLGSNHVLKLIQSNKLRLEYRRRNCANMNDPYCQEPDPPHADFPNGWGDFADILHVDFKIKSEHLIQGRQYDAEMQVFAIHTGRRRMPVHSVLIDATQFGYNYYFEEVLKEFERQYNFDLNQCKTKRERARRQLGERFNDDDLPLEVVWDDSDESPHRSYNMSESQRELQTIGTWDPNHEMLFPSIHFWRYDGSLTEPPCGEWVTWFVCDKPMKISFDQLERMKKVLFTHVDKDCQKTSVHYDHSVARPVQDSAGRAVWKCTPADFGPDQV